MYNLCMPCTNVPYTPTVDIFITMDVITDLKIILSRVFVVTTDCMAF
jgi:hypothetical protein